MSPLEKSGGYKSAGAKCVLFFLFKNLFYLIKKGSFLLYKKGKQGT